MAALLIVAGLIFLTVGAETLVRGATGLARAAGLPPLIIGLTVVAYGTSAPELAVSVKAALTGQPDIALGNVVGSNTFNVLFILGLSALIIPLVASAQLIRLDVPIMIGVSLVTWLLAGDGRIARLEGFLLALAAVAYTVFLIRLGRKNHSDAKPPGGDSNADSAGLPPTPKNLGVSVILVVIGLGLLVLGARWFVDGAVQIARAMGVSELMIGLTIIAAGTSMPEVATSIVAAIRGQRDIAVGNVVGSNIFNILAVLGFSAAVAPDGVAVAPQALRFDIPVMLAVAFACLPIFFTGGRIARSEGLLFLLYYAAYVAFLVLAAREHAALATFTSAMLYFVIPMTGLGLAVTVYTWVRSPSRIT